MTPVVWRAGLGAGLALMLSAHAVLSGAAPPTSFASAKGIARKVWAQTPVDQYCGCAYRPDQGVTQDCGFRSPKASSRPLKVEWEHVVPAADFGRQRACWRDPARPEGVSSRAHCERTDPVFARMHADPRNLIPALGPLNRVRSDHRFGEVPGEARAYGRCDFEISDAPGRFVEPPDAIKGDIARIYFHFEARHGHRIGRAQRPLFEAWSRQDPPDRAEIERERHLTRLTGEHSAYLRIPG